MGIKRLVKHLGKTKLGRQAVRYAPQLIVVLGLAVVGVVLTIHSRAAISATAQEAESGQVAGNASSQTGDTATVSGGSFVLFGTGGGGGGNPPPPPPPPPPPGGGGDRYNFDNPPTLDTCNGFAKTAPLSGYTLDKCDDFTGAALANGWSPYEGGGSDTVCDGADGAGHSRDPSHISVHDGMVTMTQDADGKTGAMDNGNFGGQYGYWEVREKDYTTASGGGAATHPVLIIWPNDGAGELDYMETDGGSDTVEVFLHDLGGGNAYNQSVTVDKSKWHVWGFEWTSSIFNGYVDGTQWFTYSGQDAQMGPGAATIQLDALNGCPVVPAKMDVDWFHVYRTGGAAATSARNHLQIGNPKRHTIH